MVFEGMRQRVGNRPIESVRMSQGQKRRKRKQKKMSIETERYRVIAKKYLEGRAK